VTPPTRATAAGRAYLDLRKKALTDRRPVDELLQFYVLECFLARLAKTGYADRFVLKGGVLLAAFGERRPTRVPRPWWFLLPGRRDGSGWSARRERDGANC
jgi:hypothetical protein